MAFLINLVEKGNVRNNGFLVSGTRLCNQRSGRRCSRGASFTLASVTNEPGTGHRAGRQQSVDGPSKTNEKRSRPYSSSGAIPKRLETIEGSSKFRYVAGNKGPDVWLIVAVLSVLLPVLFIAWAFKTGIVDPSGYQ
jgi:hypothetical protein